MDGMFAFSFGSACANQLMAKLRTAMNAM